LRGGLTGWAGRASYDGQSQGGAPVGSHTDTQSMTLDAALQWRPVASSSAQLDTGWQIERFRRHIRGAGGYSGVDRLGEHARRALGRAGAAGPQPDAGHHRRGGLGADRHR